MWLATLMWFWSSLANCSKVSGVRDLDNELGRLIRQHCYQPDIALTVGTIGIVKIILNG